MCAHSLPGGASAIPSVAALPAALPSPALTRRVVSATIRRLRRLFWRQVAGTLPRPVPANLHIAFPPLRCTNSAAPLFSGFRFPAHKRYARIQPPELHSHFQGRHRRPARISTCSRCTLAGNIPTDVLAVPGRSVFRANASCRVDCGVSWLTSRLRPP